MSGQQLFFNPYFEIKGKESVISSNPPCKDVNVWFTTVPLNPWFNQKRVRHLRFSDKKCFISVSFSVASYKAAVVLCIDGVTLTYAYNPFKRGNVEQGGENGREGL